MTSRKDLREMLAYAQATIEAAGPIALKYFREPITVEDKAGPKGFNPVTRADREIEVFIRDRINSAYPAHTIVGEEQGTSTGTDSFRWYIDPIDGTKAFISGVPLWGILLGLMDDEECRFGLMHQPYLQETYTGSDDGAYLCKGGTPRAVATRNTTELADAILYCTHPGMFSNTDDFEIFSNIAGNCKLMRYGGDCYSYCLLAHGLIDLVVEADLKPHDIIPLIPIIEAAGGVVTDWDGGNAVHGGRIVASANGVLHEQVLKLM